MTWQLLRHNPEERMPVQDILTDAWIVANAIADDAITA